MFTYFYRSGATPMLGDVVDTHGNGEATVMRLYESFDFLIAECRISNGERIPWAVNVLDLVHRVRYALQPLKWTSARRPDLFYSCAEIFSGSIYITKDCDGKYHARTLAAIHYPNGDVQHETIEAAKAAAQQWHNEVITKFLVPVS